MPAARIRPCSDSWAPRHRFFNKELSPDGRMDRRSELPRFTAPARHDACAGWESAFRDDLYGTDVGNCAGKQKQRVVVNTTREQPLPVTDICPVQVVPEC